MTKPTSFVHTKMAGLQQDQSSSQTVTPSQHEHEPFDGLKSSEVDLLRDATIRDQDHENHGECYKDIFDALQIRPERQREYYDKNFAPVMHQIIASKANKTFCHALFSCDEAARIKLTERFLRAVGRLTWHEERSWVLDATELPQDIEPLQYFIPSHATEGCHDRFLDILDGLWPRMRQMRFVPKPKVARSRATSVAMSQDISIAPRSEAVSQSGADGHRSKLPKPKRGRKIQRVANRVTELEGDHPTWQSSMLTQHVFKDFHPLPEVLDENQTEEAVQEVLQRLVEIRERCPPGMFAQVCHRNSARLDEIEVFRQQEAEVAQMGEHHSLQAQNIDLDISMSADEQLELFDRRTIPLLLANTADPKLRDESTVVGLPAALIQPATPSTIMTFIIKYRQADSFTQPYMWLDAPTRAASYQSFRQGLIYRDAVPSPSFRDFIIVLFYEWNKFCRTVRNEADWRNLFIPDLEAAARRKTLAFRMRAICIPEP